ADRFAVSLDKVVDESTHSGLMPGREMALNVKLSDGLSHGVLNQCDAALPTITLLGRTGERTAVEIEMLAAEITREIRRAGVRSMPYEPGTQRLEVELLPHLSHVREVGGHRHDHPIECIGRCRE